MLQHYFYNKKQCIGVIMTEIFFYNKYINDNNQEIDFLMSSLDESNPIIFTDKNDKKEKEFLLVPHYLGIENSKKRFQFWYDRDNPNFKIYAGQRYELDSFEDKEYVFIPAIKTITKTIQNILDIKDEYKNDIMYDDKFVFIKNYNTLQVDKSFIDKYPNNNLHLIVKMNPKLIEIDDDIKEATNSSFSRRPETNLTEEEKQKIEIEMQNKKKIIDNFLEQEIDLPIQLIELLMLGISCKARTANVFQMDNRTGTAYAINPYLERYELAVKKAVDNQFINQVGIEKRDISTKGFF